MADTGFTPATVAVSPGGAVTWVNHGDHVHTATSVGGAPLPFDTAGIAQGQSASFAFGTPGTYYYTSSTDCLNGHYFAQFPCNVSFSVIVSASIAQANATTTSLIPTPAPSSTPNPAASGVPVANAVASIDDQGITPVTITLALGGSITFGNHGSIVHAATSPGTNSWPGFDSGGLAPGQSATISINQVGIFTYTSPPDCLNGNKNPAFSCGPYQIAVVAAGPAAAAQPTPAATPLPPLAAPNPSPVVAVDDANGFTPHALTVKAGQSVTWTNKGAQVHNVTSDPGYIPAFNSGGIGAGATFSFTFTQPGSYTYRSQIDAIYISSPTCNCAVPTYTVFAGVVNVTP